MARVVRCSDEVTLRKYQAIIVSDDGKWPQWFQSKWAETEQ
jgi:hypothetical protein